MAGQATAGIATPSGRPEALGQRVEQGHREPVSSRQRPQELGDGSAFQSSLKPICLVSRVGAPRRLGQLSGLHCRARGTCWREGGVGAKSGTMAESLAIRMGCLKAGQHQQPVSCSISSLDAILRRWGHWLSLLPVNTGNLRGSAGFSSPALCLPP